MSTKIEWCDETWNPVHGCTHAGSPGCDMCYARRMARRLQGRCGYPEAPDYFKVTLRPDRLEQPLKWRKPRRVFVVSMGDLFHEDVPVDFVDSVFSRMEVGNWHTYQILTKRPENMLKYIRAAYPFGDLGKHIWLGVTAENQAMADERIPLLLQTPAAVRFVSCEPLLSEIDLTRYIECPFCAHAHTMPSGTLDCLCGHLLDWVIAGGETGPGARPMPPNGARNLRDQCQAAGVSYFFKQHGEWLHFERRAKSSGGYYHADNGKRLPVDEFIDKPHEVRGDFGIARVGNKAAGHLLDGREWREMPGGVK